MVGKQLGFSDDELTTAKKQTKREKFLSEMKAVVPWQALVALIEPHYPKTSKKGGRPPYPMATMLRIHLLKQWYSLSDPAMEEALIEVPNMRRFAGIDLISVRIPDETTIVRRRLDRRALNYICGSQDATTRLPISVWSLSMPAPLSLRIKERYLAKRADGLSQQVAADAVGISVRSAQRIDRGELQPERQLQRGRHWRTRADPLAEVWDSVLVPMLEKAPQLEPHTLLLHLERTFPGQEWYRRKRTLQRRVEQWRALHGPAQEVMFLQEHRAGVLGISDFTLLKGEPITVVRRQRKLVRRHENWSTP